MKHFGLYRKLILTAGTVTAAVSVSAVFFMESPSALTLFVIFSLAILCGFLFLLAFLYYRFYTVFFVPIYLLIGGFNG